MNRAWRIALASTTLGLATIVGVHLWRGRLPAPAPSPRMDRITLERTGCFGPCPAYTVTVERNGDATFRATRALWDGKDRLRQSHLEWHTRVPDDALRALIAAVESPAYARLRPEYSVMVTDNPSKTLVVEGNGLRRSTLVYVVPCRKDMSRNPETEYLRGVEPVPDVFCDVAQLVDVASCARYWARYSRGPFGGAPNPHPLPPRCKPRP